MTKEEKAQESVDADLSSAADESLWRTFVSAHKTLATIEHMSSSSPE